jgi:hypothetical protein
MTNWKGLGRSGHGPILKCNPGIHLEGLRKMTKTSVMKAGIWAKIAMRTVM